MVGVTYNILYFLLLLPLTPPTSCPPQWCNIPTINTFQHLYKDTKFYCCKEKATCTCVAVLGGNQTFCYIFRLCYQILQQKFHWGRCSYTLWGVHASILCTLIRSSALQHFKHNNTIEMRNGNDRFLPRTARCNKQWPCICHFPYSRNLGIETKKLSLCSYQTDHSLVGGYVVEI